MRTVGIGAKKPTGNDEELKKEIKDLKAKNAQLKKENKELQKQVDDLKAQLEVSEKAEE